MAYNYCHAIKSITVRNTLSVSGVEVGLILDILCDFVCTSNM